MDILVTLPHELRGTLISDALEERIEALGNVHWNTSGGQFTESTLRDRIKGVNICVTGWRSPAFTESVVEAADDLELVVHIGGTVAPIASEALYDRDIPICSAITEMAPFVAEGILAMILSTLRDLPHHDAALKQGEWSEEDEPDPTLFGASVGFVGLGSVGEALLDLLAPFGVDVSVYDPYIDNERLADYGFAGRTGLKDLFQEADVVSIHAAKTRETIGMVDAECLAQLPDGALLVNTARAAIIEQEALFDELRTGRISAALDVFKPEPLPVNSELRDFENVLLVPHRAGIPSQRRIAEAMTEEVERFVTGNSLRHRIPREHFQLMTDEALNSVDKDS